MNIRPIRTDADLRVVLKEVSRLVGLDPAPDTPEGDRLLVLGTLVRAYEREHFPIERPDPIEGIKFRMEQGA